MLPVYFDSNAEAQTILGLSVKNKIETEDYVYGRKGVATSGICDLTISGGYGSDMTITVSRSQLADLYNRIEELEEQVATLSEIVEELQS